MRIAAEQPGPALSSGARSLIGGAMHPTGRNRIAFAEEAALRGRAGVVRRRARRLTAPERRAERGRHDREKNEERPCDAVARDLHDGRRKQLPCRSRRRRSCLARVRAQPCICVNVCLVRRRDPGAWLGKRGSAGLFERRARCYGAPARCRFISSASYSASPRSWRAGPRLPRSPPGRPRRTLPARPASIQKRSTTAPPRRVGRLFIRTCTVQISTTAPFTTSAAAPARATTWLRTAASATPTRRAPAR